MFKITTDQAADLLEGTEYVEMVYKYFNVLPSEFEPPYEWYANEATRELKLLLVRRDTDDPAEYDVVFTATGLNMCRLNSKAGMIWYDEITHISNLMIKRLNQISLRKNKNK